MDFHPLSIFVSLIFAQLINCSSARKDVGNAGLQKELIYAINEESEVGSFVGNLKLDAERKFLIPYDQLTGFELYDDSKQGYFRVEQDSGKLYVASRIDRETICPQPDALLSDRLSSYANEFWSTLPADSQADVQPDGTLCQIHLALHIAQQYWLNVIVTVHDINDHKPYFPLGSSGTEIPLYTVNVSESVTAGYELPLVGAKDADAGVNSVQSYSLRGAELDPTLFTIAYKPPFMLNLVILRELDAETKSSYTGELVACDGGQPQPLCGVQPFQIIVTDLNDNKPVFSKTMYEVEIDEIMPINSTVIRLSATDADSGPRGQLRYAFGQPISQAVQHHFTLDPITGELSTRRALNARDNPRFIIPVIAKDGGLVPLIGQTVVQITVRDVNDHDPWIEVRPVQSVISSSPDHGNRTDSDNRLSVLENQPIGTNIGLIIAGDEDVGDNSVVVCQLKSHQNGFYLEHANSAKGREMYRLGTNMSFDRESLPDGVVYLNVLCLDGGHPKRSTERKIPVLVLDQNEFPPVFEASKRVQHVYLDEGKPVGTFVTRIQASDADATPSILYQLSREAQTLFHIDPDSGVITTRMVLDREQMPKIRFSVFALDHATNDLEPQAAVANLTVHLVDINDNAPELTGNRAFHIVENRPGFSDLVGQLTSIDKDVGNNGTVNYRLVSVSGNGNPLVNDTFMLNADTGKLFTLYSLDREMYSQYELVVLLEDQGTPEPLNSTETIIVEVLDENDNVPIWGEPLRIITTVEHLPTPEQLRKSSRMLGLSKLHELGYLNASTPLYHGQKITKLVATDPDAPHNANLSYHLLGTYFTPFNEGSELSREQTPTVEENPNMLTHFKLSSITGDLFIGPGLGGVGAVKGGLAELYLRVCDNGNPPLDASARLFIQLTTFNPRSVTDGSTGGGFLAYLISTGHLGIALIVVLFVIMCLTSICLVVAFATIRRKSPGRTNSCLCCPSRARKSFRTSMDHGAVQQNTQFTLDDTGITFDGQLSALGRVYRSPKTQSIFSDGTSLYKWVPECNYPIGNFGPPPIYNLPLLSGTVDRMHSSHTGSDKSAVALLPCEYPCASSHSYDDRGSVEENGADLILGRCDTQALIRRPVLEVSRCTQAMDLAKRTENPPSTKPQTTSVTISEIDGGSADSGQGASEEEAIGLDGLRHGFAPLQPLRVQEFPLRKPDLLVSTQSPLSKVMCSTVTGAQLIQNSQNITSTSGLFSTITTFTHQTDLDRAKATPSPTLILPPPPACIECAKPRWQRPLFTHSDFGHHNQLFEEFPRATNPPPRQSFTLPPASKMATQSGGQERRINCSPNITRSKIATLSSLPGK